MMGLTLGLVAILGAMGAGRWLLPDADREDVHGWVHALISGLLLWGMAGAVLLRLLMFAFFGACGALLGTGLHFLKGILEELTNEFT